MLIMGAAILGLIFVVGLYLWMGRPTRQLTLVEQATRVSAAEPIVLDVNLDCSGLHSYLRLDIEGANLLTQAKSKTDPNQAALRIGDQAARVSVTQYGSNKAPSPAPYRKLGPRGQDVVFELASGPLSQVAVATDRDFTLERARLTCYRKPPSQ